MLSEVNWINPLPSRNFFIFGFGFKRSSLKSPNITVGCSVDNVSSRSVNCLINWAMFPCGLRYKHNTPMHRLTQA